jgi:Dual specificity phosphatase, catalytic domain
LKSANLGYLAFWKYFSVKKNTVTRLDSLFKHRSKMQPVLPNLYISSWYTISTADVLENDGITHVLSVMTGSADSARLKPFKRMIIDVEDDPDEPLIDYFEAAIQWIDDAIAEGGKALVHWYISLSKLAPK